MSIRAEKIQFFEHYLVDFFQKAGRVELSWRKPGITAYEVWVSEIMLQQTQVSRVIGYYQKFLKRFPTVEVLAKATWEEFLPYYQGLGYYARGRNMLLTAQRVVAEFGGEFPRDRMLLETLPGVGPYTASAIMSFAYGGGHLAWDTNLKRVIGRFFLGGKQLITDEALWEKRFMTPKKELNAALMDFGSALCVARPKCGACPLSSRCIFFKEKGLQESRILARPTGGKNQESRKWKKRKGESGVHDWARTRVMVFLHENHKKYFSSLKNRFQPFILPSGYTTRADIKEYFLNKYGLTLAVRSPHKKEQTKGQLWLWVNAQVLLGRPKFQVFGANARRAAYP